MSIENLKKGPDFIGIGVQRAGTSWLYQCLNEHKEIHLPAKELHFFDRKYDKGMDWYLSLFDKESQHKVTGEFTPDYISCEFSMKQIAEHFPSAKLIVLLRDPFERAYSAYNLHVTYGDDKGQTFAEAIEEHPSFIEKSLYYDQLQRVFELFPKEQVAVYDFDDVAKRPLWLVQSIYEFLGVDSTFVPPQFDSKYNVSGMSGLQNKLNLPHIQNRMREYALGRQILKVKKFKAVRRLKSWILDLSKEENLKAKYCSPELRARFKEDLQKTSELVNMNFEKWY